MYQQSAARRHAPPIVAPAPGLPLIKNTASLGRMLEWRRGRSVCDEDMPPDLKERHILRDLDIFIKWMEKEDGAHFRGVWRREGPFPHTEFRRNDVQVGDQGGKREVARNLIRDSEDTGKEAWILWALFDVPEMIQEVPTSMALDLFKKRSDLRPLREKDWRGVLRG
jgi:hypothetical protein